MTEPEVYSSDESDYRMTTLAKYCRPSQRTAWASVFLLTALFTGLVLIGNAQWNKNFQLKKADFKYDNSKMFGVVTDIHLDLYQNSTHCRSAAGLKGVWVKHFPTNYPGKPCDSSLDHATMTLDSFQRTAAKHGDLEFITLLGDNLAHHTVGWNISLGSIGVVKSLITDRFPSTPVYFTLGNHDWPVTSYQLPVNIEDWYKEYWDLVSPMLHNSGVELQKAASTFTRFGYFSIKHGESLTVVSLNTMVASKYVNVSDTVMLDQFKWLEETLQEVDSSGSGKVLLIGHIPPDTELDQANEWKKTKSMTWKNNLVPEFNRIISQFSHLITFSLFAHQHTDGWFAKQVTDGQPVAHFLMPQVTPGGDGHPSYTIGVLSQEWGLLDFLYYYCTLELFTRSDKEPYYEFLHSFKQIHYNNDDKYLPIDLKQLDLLTNRIVEKEDNLWTYNSVLMNQYQLGYRPNVEPHQMFCVMSENTADGLDRCLTKYFY